MPRPRYEDSIELLQGTLDLLILETLQWGPRHGYGIAQSLRTHSGQLLDVDTGSLYPALHRLERAKQVASSWTTSERKQRVKVYRLTDRGRKHLVAERSRWERLQQAITNVLRTAARGSAGGE